MAEKKNRQQVLCPLGVTLLDREVRILVYAEGEKLSLLLYHPGDQDTVDVIDFREEERIGDVWSMTLSGYDFEKLEYAFLSDGVRMTDPCARMIVGREKWGDLEREAGTERARLVSGGFDWENDRKPEIPYSDTILYRLHVRGFTKSPSSGVKAKGTFAGVREKIPYLKELGITSVELMPITEFNEVIYGTEALGSPDAKPKPTGTLNYWGYGPSFLYAVKAAYGSGKKKPENEFKELVKALHKESMECITEMFFTGKEPVEMVLDVLRYWITEYHVDGFRLSGFPPLGAIAEDPFLRRTKLFAENWDFVQDRERRSSCPEASEGKVTLRKKNLAVYNNRFETDMRRFLKGDEGMLNSAAFHIRNNPSDRAVINYMANTNGMTMMDMVSYDRKHNEENHEGNRDGAEHNFSWNCGEEGPTRKKKVRDLRRQQLCNAFLMLFLSQGTPLLLAGDEFGNTQNGNNNAYCQDNQTGWVDWKLLKANQDIWQFVKSLIAFRKEHGVFHGEREPRLLDYRSCGRPDVSYHGEYVWQPEFEAFRRQLGVLYWGSYGTKPDGSEDDTFYVLYNMHWEPHVFGLPRLPKGQLWHIACDTSRGPEKAVAFGETAALEDQTQLTVPPRCILVLYGRNGSGYYTYETPVGEITVWCRDEKVTGIRFGRTAPEEKDLKEVRTPLSDHVFEELTEYFEGKRKEFDLPLAPEGTEFQKKVWNALQTIPWGETRSYKEIAAAVGDEKACRAVGMANNRNPIAIVIPCHRVVGADGTLVGYAGGLSIKERLLELEKADKQKADKQKADKQ